MNIDKDTTSYGLMSAVCGALAMGAWLVPVIGAILSLFALYTGGKALNNHEDGWPLAGIALGLISIILTVLRSGLVYYYG